MIKSTSLLMIALFFSVLVDAQEIAGNNGISIGYQVSKPSFSTISYDKGWFRTEGRIMVNNDNPGDFEWMAAWNYLRYEEIMFYVGIGGQVDFQDFYPIPITVPIGAVIYPFENNKLSLVMEVAPVFGDFSYPSSLDWNYLRGSIGFRYLIKQGSEKIVPARNRKKKDTLDIDFHRGYYLTLAGPSAGIGFQYSMFKNNFDWHVGLTTIIPYGLYGGLYYHFVRKHSSSNFHVYTGLDVGMGYYDGWESSYKPTAYVPLGLQYIANNKFTVSLEAAAFLNPDEKVIPWLGIKIGKTMMKGQ